MDGREGIMPGSSSYFINSGLGSPNSRLPPLLHGPPGMRHVSNPNPNLPPGTSFQFESLGSSTPMSVNVGISGSAGAGQGEPTKRKRGRPRKYGPDGSVALALSPLSFVTPISGSGSGSVGVSGSGSSTPRRGRGRPPGTGRKQQLASLGEWVAGSAGMGFTPHIITIDVGEDIASKIMSFSQQGPRAVCILSANGAVSRVTLRHPATSGGTVTYEGRFEILCLSGSYLLTEDAGSRNRSGGLSISLANPDGRMIGGGVGGLLIAASPVQVIVGSFLYGGSKAKKKGKTDHDPVPENEIQMGDTQSTPTSALPSETLDRPLMGGWPGSRHSDIDLTRG